MTKYCIELRTPDSKHHILRFDNMLERALVIVAYSGYCDVVREWTE